MAIIYTNQSSGAIRRAKKRKPTKAYLEALSKHIKYLKKFTNNKITFINSAHHQGVDKLGNNLTVTGTAPDGIIEGFKHQSHYYCVGAQWHPEFLITDFDKKFIQDFVNHVKKNI